MKRIGIKNLSLAVCLLLTLLGCKEQPKEETIPTSDKITETLATAQVVESKALYPYYEFQEERVWGYLNQEGKSIIAPRFKSAGPYDRNGIAIVSISNGGRDQYGLIDRKGQYMIEPQYTSIFAFPEGVFVAEKDGKNSSILDEKGKLVANVPGALGEFSEGMASLKTNKLYGYVDTKGSIVIEPKFNSVHPFHNGKALVSGTDGKYQLIDGKGEVLHTYNAQIYKDFREGLAAVKLSKDTEYGFINESGDVVISEQYQHAEEFHEGLAAVWTNMSKQTAGLIDIKGEYVLPAQYGDIRYLGNSIWAVSKEYRDDYSSPRNNYRFALFGKDGMQKTDFIFDAVEEFAGDYAVVEEGLSTYFIDKSGKKADSLPTIDGIGHVIVQDDVISADVDNRLRYITTSGKVIWTATVYNKDLGHGIRLKEKKYRPNRDVLIFYPELDGMQDDVVQNRLNEELKKAAVVGETGQDKDSRFSYDVNFSVSSLQNNLLVLELNSYWYSGGAHGMPGDSYVHIDLQSGHIYKLEELFKKGSPYLDEISKNLKGQMLANGVEMGMFENSIKDFKQIESGQPFYIKDQVLNIYFYPYEIGSYAAGFITFQIPLTDLDAFIDKEGAFWRSFH